MSWQCSIAAAEVMTVIVCGWRYAVYACVQCQSSLHSWPAVLLLQELAVIGDFHGWELELHYKRDFIEPQNH